MAQPQVYLKPIHPIVNFNNPITHGLVFDAPMFEGAGQFVSDDATVLEDLLGTLVGATWNKNFYGTDIDFSGSTSSIAYTVPASVQGLFVFSFELLLYFRSSGGGALGRAIHKKGVSNGWFQFYYNSATTSWKLDTNMYLTTQGSWQMGSPVANTWYHIVGTMDASSVSNAPTVYQNGIPLSNTQLSANSGSAASDDANLYIGNRGDSIRNWDGKISYARIWNRVLTPTEVWSLYTNPWQIYVQPNSRYQRLNSIAAAATAIKMQSLRGWSWAI